MANKFEQDVLKRLPGYAVVEGNFYRPPVGPILVAFAYDKPPRRIRPILFAMPLYDRVRLSSLSYCDYLPYPQKEIERQAFPGVRLAEEYLRIMLPYAPRLHARADPATFLEYLLNREYGLDPPWSRRAYAMTLIWLGRCDEARPHLELLLNERIDTESDQLFHEEMAALRADLDAGPGVARARLLQWEATNRQKYGL